MDFFPDGTHVWLRIREYDDDYLYASEDGDGVGWSEDVGLDAAWAVHRVVRDGTDYVLFHSASYGQYLALVETKDEDVAEDEEEIEFDTYRPGQCTYDSPEQENVLFQARRAEDGSESPDDIFLSNPRFGVWCYEYAMPLHWLVQAIPPRRHPPALPHPIPVNPQQPLAVCSIGPRGGHVAAVQPPAVLRRRINYVRADDQGQRNFNPFHWRVLQQFEGQSVFNLRRDLAAALGEANNGLGITLCVWGGSHGRWTPLVIDLPSDEETMYIVVLTTGSPAALALRYPNVDAE